MKTKSTTRKLLKLFKEEMLIEKIVLQNIYLFVVKSIYNLLQPSISNEIRWVLPDMTVNSRFFDAILERIPIYHTIQCIDDVLQNCAPESYIIVLTSVIPIIPIKRKVKKKRLEKKKKEHLYKKITYHLKQKTKTKTIQK